VDSLESDSPSLGDNIGESPHWVEPEATDSGLRNHRPFTRLLNKQYHSDTKIVNDVVTSRVRKRTFGRTSCFRIRYCLAPAARSSGLCEKFLEAGCWVVDSRNWPCIKESTCGGSRLKVVSSSSRFSCQATAMVCGRCPSSRDESSRFDGGVGKLGDLCETDTRRPVSSVARDGMGNSSHSDRSRIRPPGPPRFRPRPMVAHGSLDDHPRRFSRIGDGNAACDSAGLGAAGFAEKRSKQKWGFSRRRRPFRVNPLSRRRPWRLVACPAVSRLCDGLILCKM